MTRLTSVLLLGTVLLVGPNIHTALGTPPPAPGAPDFRIICPPELLTPTNPPMSQIPQGQSASAQCTVFSENNYAIPAGGLTIRTLFGQANLLPADNPPQAGTVPANLLPAGGAIPLAGINFVVSVTTAAPPAATPVWTYTLTVFLSEPPPPVPPIPASQPLTHSYAFRVSVFDPAVGQRQDFTTTLQNAGPLGAPVGGAAVADNINITPLNTFGGPVHMDAVALPAGSPPAGSPAGPPCPTLSLAGAAVVNNAVLTCGASANINVAGAVVATLTVQSAAGTAPGDYTIYIITTAPGAAPIIRTTQVALRV